MGGRRGGREDGERVEEGRWWKEGRKREWERDIVEQWGERERGIVIRS